MDFIARLLITNEKRVQYQVEEKTVCTDGLMLNMLSVLQFLSVKVSGFSVEVIFWLTDADDYRVI